MNEVILGIRNIGEKLLINKNIILPNINESHMHTISLLSNHRLLAKPMSNT
jgi:hypothetical protein